MIASLPWSHVAAGETMLLRSKFKKSMLRVPEADGECIQSLPPPQP